MRNRGLISSIVYVCALLVLCGWIAYTVHSDPNSIQKAWDALPSTAPPQAISQPRRAPAYTRVNKVPDKRPIPNAKSR